MKLRLSARSFTDQWTGVVGPKLAEQAGSAAGSCSACLRMQALPARTLQGACAQKRHRRCRDSRRM